MIGYPLDSHVEFGEDNVPVFDRAITSAPLRKLIKQLFSDGIMPNASTNMQVVAGSKMKAVVKSGFAICNGCLKLEEDQTTLTLEAADASYGRIDTIVLRLDDNDNARSCEFAVVKGTASANPVRPTLTRNQSVWEIGLADIKVPAQSVAVRNDRITDTRYESDRCGVISSISEFDTTGIYQQVQSDLKELRSEEQTVFDTWFNSIKDQLGTDAAGKLLQLIEVERARINALASLKDGSTTGDAELQDIRIGADGKSYESAGEAVRSQFRDFTKEYEFIPVTLDDIDTQHINAYFTVKGAGNVTFGELISMATLEGYCTHTAKVSKGDCLLLTNAHNLTSRTPYLIVFGNDGKCVDQVSFDYLKDAKYYDKRYVFAEDGFFYICFDYTKIQSGEFFYIKRTHRKEPFVLYAEKAESYVDDADTGEAVMKAIMEGRQIVVRVPNADGGNYMALYSPVLMYQLPNYLARHLYLFYLNDGVNEMGLPSYSQLKIAVSRDYNQTPLF